MFSGGVRNGTEKGRFRCYWPVGVLNLQAQWRGGSLVLGVWRELEFELCISFVSCSATWCNQYTTTP